jgi:putative transposase
MYIYINRKKNINYLVESIFKFKFGINYEGKKDVLGVFLSESERTNFWLSFLTDLKWKS